MKYACNQPRYGLIIDCDCSPILVSHNNWVVMNFIGDEKDDFEYEHINIRILNGNATKIMLILCKGIFGDTDSEDTSFHG